MSMFLPEGMNQGQAQPGTADITPASPETTSSDIALMQRVLAAAARNVNLIPPDFMAYVVDFIQTSRLQIPISQVPGFKQFTVKAADDVATVETTASAVYVDLATAGPSLMDLSDGVYLVQFGARMLGTIAGQLVLMSVSANGAAAVDNNSIQSDSTANFQSGMRSLIVTLNSGGANTLEAKYKVTGGTGSFGYRFLHALRISN